MICFQSGEAIVFTDLEKSEVRRLAKTIAWFARELWRMLQDRKEVEGTPVVVLHCNDPKHQNGLIVSKDLVAVRVDPVGLARLAATNEFRGSEPRERVLRALRVTLAEELHHLWMFYQKKMDFSCPHKDSFTDDPVQVVEHYNEPIEFEALQFVYEVTGEREELLTSVLVYRTLEQIHIDS